jgi:hypothetical protein
MSAIHTMILQDNSDQARYQQATELQVGRHVLVNCESHLMLLVCVYICSIYILNRSYALLILFNDAVSSSDYMTSIGRIN